MHEERSVKTVWSVGMSLAGTHCDPASVHSCVPHMDGLYTARDRAFSGA